MTMGAAIQIDADAPPAENPRLISTGADNTIWAPVDGAAGALATLFYLRALPDGSHLNFPVKIEMSVLDDGLIDAFAPVLQLGGVGQSAEQAVRDLVATAVSLWQELGHTQPGSLHESGAKALARLSSVFGPAK
jgi:hypothetical protein